ncbi:hypothetical protein GCM10019016_118290 [Streptomyces prasinosporus]|uniref:DUF1648 domain-containing protein n=1 Tax=Streptomyces prasinosporus TaxID=68256 RepID=A0ABP6UEV0_9ACTN
MVLSPAVRLRLLPNVVLLAVMGVWGAVRYPRLPDRTPEHIDVDAVDAWTDRSIGSAFLLVFVYAVMTVLMIGSAELTLRMTPCDELTDANRPSFAGGLSSTLLNRPAGRASARRIARALLLFNTCIGACLLVGCGTLGRSAPDPDVPGRLFAAMSTPLLAGTALTVAATPGDRKR